MNDIKLDDCLNVYARTHTPEPSRELINSIMRIPHEVEQKISVPWKISDWFMFLVPRVSGLTAACVMGIYIGGAGSSALAEDEIAVIDQEVIESTNVSIALDANVETLLDVEEFIFVEEPAQ